MPILSTFGYKNKKNTEYPNLNVKILGTYRKSIKICSFLFHFKLEKKKESFYFYFLFDDNQLKKITEKPNQQLLTLALLRKTSILN